MSAEHTLIPMSHARHRSSRSSSKYLDITAMCSFSLCAATADTNTTTRPALLQCYSICSVLLVSCFALPAPLKQLPSCLPLFPSLPTLWGLCSTESEGLIFHPSERCSLHQESGGADSSCHKMRQLGSCRLQVSEEGCHQVA